MSRTRPVVLALVLGVAPATVACGGGGPPLSGWLDAADEICTVTQKEADQSRPVLTTPSLMERLKKSSTLSKAETNQLRNLERPADRRDEVREYLAALDDRTTAIDVHVAGLNGGMGALTDETGMDEIAAATQKAADRAKALGLEVCLAGIDMALDDAAGSGPVGPLVPVVPDDTTLGEGPPPPINEYQTSESIPEG